ncbi:MULTISPECIES: hypothetical protein [Pseudomonas aeruginosa group]|uniref:Secreted protein n=2 Tax=Pseudomonas paraeruginosa TaxID=2994495 RepID=A0A2R3IWS1_9PSED|nr:MULTISPECIES: hypothetical protein [Pseudomonas aeruginosa group]AVK06293.1 hypothetical protein CSB93_1293 [Pseudomonas paraeruginosa]AWE93817.1 hypothetical protein CSC28_0063 [Pseudomonas paraeruginosa]KSD78842.1 hypothetical protein AO903_02800 [Pseudomonas aeruginosa]MCT9631160.1 hypothetical protein [Pseudomonas aeruginosa]MCW8032363.1 hypothetical protein [Pseudomonas aeruginosa]
MRYARFASRRSLLALAVAAALLPGASWAASGERAAARKPPSVACAWNRDAPLSYEERRLDTPLPFSGANVVTHDQTPLAERIVKGAGFDGFEPAFARRLCADNGRTPVTSYAKALKLVTEEGRALWRAAVDRVQGRRAIPAGALPASDDRMLYWTRTYMTRTLRQWAPSFGLSQAQAQALQWRFERASRGQLDIDLPRRYAADGSRYRRMIISGFDVFTLGAPGTPNTGLRNGNPSGATALALDGREIRLSDGSLLRIEAYLLPVSYDPFNRGMQEDTLGPWFRPGPRRVDASITISQGGANQFWLEAWNGRFHGSSAGNDGIVYCPADKALPNYVLPLGSVTNPGSAPISLPGSGCNINPPRRWLGYDSASHWRRNLPAQFSRASLPVRQLLAADTWRGIERPPGATSQAAEGFDVTWHTNYAFFPDCANPQTESVPSNGVMNAMPDPALVLPPNRRICARNGGGGDYLSNESAYRNTVLRDTFGLDIPAGHIHVPVMNNYYTGSPASGGGARNDNAISDARYEAYRSAIVAQTRALLVGVGNALAQGAKAD